MSLQRLLVRVADACRHRAVLVVLAGAVCAALSLLFAAGHLGVTTNTSGLFSSRLSWRRAADEFNRQFPQFDNLLVIAIDAAEPEEAEQTAADLAAKLQADKTNFTSVTRPDASPFFHKEGLLFLSPTQLSALMDQTIAAQPFLGQLVADPSARGLFSALALLGMGASQGNVDLSPYFPALRGFDAAIRNALDGHPQPLSWQALLGGGLTDLAGKYHFVLAQPRLNYGSLEPGGEATLAIRTAAAGLPFVVSGQAHVAITGQVALSDEEFSSVAEGVAVGLVASIVLITLWLFLAVKTWRLIVPILLTLVLGLSLTLFFAAAAVGTLNLISVGFGILFVGIAVDFAIQFSVRFRERRHEFADFGEAIRQTAVRTGEQILVAAVATAAGFLAFVPTDFVGVAELGLIAGVGMLIAFVCTITFLPAAITLFRPPGEPGLVGFHWAIPLDPLVAAWRKPILLVFAAVAIAGVALSPGLAFDSNPLDTKNQHTEAMRTLRALANSPLTNPYTIDILAPSVPDAAALAAKLRPLSTVDSVRSLDSFVPADQDKKLAIIQDAQSILEPTLTAPASTTPVTPAVLRMAAGTALEQITPALPKLKPDTPLQGIAADLKRLTTAPDAVVMATNASLTRFLPQELDQLRDFAECRARDGCLPPAGHQAGLGAAGRARPHSGAAEAGDQCHERRPGGVREAGDGGGAGRRWAGRDDRSDQCDDRRRIPLRRDICVRGDRGDSVHRAAPAAGRCAGAGAAGAVRADDASGRGAAAAAAELRQHHRPAAAAGGGRRIQHLFRDELACRTHPAAGIGDGTGDRLLRPDHQHGVRLIGTVAPPGHREHGGVAADQPGLHAAG